MRHPALPNLPVQKRITTGIVEVVKERSACAICGKAADMSVTAVETLPNGNFGITRSVRKCCQKATSELKG